MNNDNVIADTTTQTDSSINAIDAAVDAQARRKANKLAGTSDSSPAGDAAATEKAKRRIYTPEERLERAKGLEEARAERARNRKAASEAKRSEAQAQRGVPHMSKVAKAGAGLAALDAETAAIFEEVKAALSQTQIDILTAHLAFYSRATSTTASLDRKLEEGTRVRIVSGPARFIGKEGVVAKWQRVHCYITVPGYNKDCYLFCSNVEPLDTEADVAEQVSDEANAA